MRPLASAIAAEFDDIRYRDDLAAIVGPRTNDELAAWLAALCRTWLAQDVVGAHFANKSVGAVFGLALADSTSVVLKLFPASFTDDALHAIERCLAGVCAAGFPAPRQLVPLFTADGVRGAFYELVAGDVLDAHRPDVRQTLAGALAAFARIALDPTGLPLAHADALWGTPHRVGIDLAVPGGEWIDARAEAALRTIRAIPLPLIAAHMDWGTKNALFADGRLRAILDWDSLMRASEAEMVGRAAAELHAQWEFPARLTPTPEEAAAFVDEYETARGRRFTTDERRVIAASADYLLAQVARQGHTGPDCPDDDFRALLRATATAPLIPA